MAQLEELQEHTGLTDTVRSSLFVGDTVFAGCADLTGWSITSNAQTLKYKEHEKSIYCLSNIDGLIYSGSADKTFKSWDTRIPKSVHTFKGHTNTVRCITSVLVNGKLYLITGSYDNTIKFWNLATQTCFYSISPQVNYINCLVVAYPYLWAGGEGVALKFDISNVFTNSSTHTKSGEIKGHSEAVTSIHLYEGQVITGSVDSSAKVWKEKGSGYVSLNTLQTESSCAASVIVPEVGSLFTCGSTVKVWSLDGWYNSCTERVHTQPIRSLAVSLGTTNLLASGAQDKSQKIWRIID